VAQAIGALLISMLALNLRALRRASRLRDPDTPRAPGSFSHRRKCGKIVPKVIASVTRLRKEFILGNAA